MCIFVINCDFNILIPLSVSTSKGHPKCCSINQCLYGIMAQGLHETVSLAKILIIQLMKTYAVSITYQYRVTQKSINQKNSLVLTGIFTVKNLPVNLQNGVTALRVVHRTWKISFRKIFVNSISNKLISNVFYSTYY
jgi:hypothetical protein